MEIEKFLMVKNDHFSETPYIHWVRTVDDEVFLEPLLLLLITVFII